MFYYRYKLDEPSYDRDCIRLHKMIQVGEAELVSIDVKTKNEVWKYHNEKDERIEYVMINPNIALTGDPFWDDFIDSRVLGFVSLSLLKNWLAIETMILYVNPMWRRFGVAYKLYENILNDGQIVICGNQHNPKSRALWLKLLQDKRFVVWAHDVKNLDRTSDVWIDENNELICNLKLYVDIKMKKRNMKEDIRLIAINPRKV